MFLGFLLHSLVFQRNIKITIFLFMQITPLKEMSKTCRVCSNIIFYKVFCKIVCENCNETVIYRKYAEEIGTSDLYCDGCSD